MNELLETLEVETAAMYDAMNVYLDAYHAAKKAAGGRAVEPPQAEVEALISQAQVVNVFYEAVSAFTI